MTSARATPPPGSPLNPANLSRRSGIYVISLGAPFKNCQSLDSSINQIEKTKEKKFIEAKPKQNKNLNKLERPPRLKTKMRVMMIGALAAGYAVGLSDGAMNVAFYGGDANCDKCLQEYIETIENMEPNPKKQCAAVERFRTCTRPSNPCPDEAEIPDLYDDIFQCSASGTKLATGNRTKQTAREDRELARTKQTARKDDRHDDGSTLKSVGLRGSSPSSKGLIPRQLGSRCKSKDAVWIPNSSMTLNGDWYGTVNNGQYHCMLSKNSGKYAYRIDCNKDGGDATDFYFNDGNDKYELLMKKNGGHTVKYNGNDSIIAIGYCN